MRGGAASYSERGDILMKIGAIILAAGSSKRMGEPKLLLPVKEKPMFLHAVERAIESNLSPIHVVAGKYITQIERELIGLPVYTSFNKDYDKGMSTSLKLGIALVTGLCDAVIIFLADQPLVPLTVIESIKAKYMKCKSKIIRPKYNSVPGHPILFDGSLFSDFIFIEGDSGGKTIIERYKTELEWLEFEEEEWGRDIDTREEYNQLLLKIDQ